VTDHRLDLPERGDLWSTNHGCFFLDASGITLDLNGHTITDTKLRVDSGTVGIMAFKGGNKILGPGTSRALTSESVS
jgi:hypothetical protein